MPWLPCRWSVSVHASHEMIEPSSIPRGDGLTRGIVFLRHSHKPGSFRAVMSGVALVVRTVALIGGCCLCTGCSSAAHQVLVNPSNVLVQPGLLQSNHVADMARQACLLDASQGSHACTHRSKGCLSGHMQSCCCTVMTVTSISPQRLSIWISHPGRRPLPPGHWSRCRRMLRLSPRHSPNKQREGWPPA